MNSDVCMPPTTQERPDVHDNRKTPKQICLCVIEKLNMMFLVFFICYLSWSIPANYGLFTSGSSYSNVSLDYDSKQAEDVNSTERKNSGNLLFNFTGFSSKYNNDDDNFMLEQIRLTKQRKRHKGKRKKNKKRKKKKTKNNSIENINNGGRRRRKNKKCKKCGKGKKLQRTKFRQHMFKLEPTTIRHIIERVAEEALQKGAGSMDFGLNYNPFESSKNSVDQWSTWGECSVTCNSGQKSRSRGCGMSCRETETMVCFMPSCKREKKPKGDTASREFNRYFPSSGSVEYINEDVDTCEEWIDCNNQTIKTYLNKSYLPSCPCYYPLHLDYNNKVWDRQKQKHFKWLNIIISEEGLNAYKPNAQYCIRSKLYRGTETLAAQFCCYDDTMRLITRGKSAGTPNLISPEISQELHHKLDISPWIICKGDWTRYNEVIQPNNGLNCRDNPNEEDIKIQVFQAQNF
ncbi:isthmin-like isoform X1 [Mytilus galloprovincialis]|uniref:isthmin-like isoform X1 n=1 Tax=Mytilus galloprovincialis TaxID=29158 RepID=UPI003F7C6506